MVFKSGRPFAAIQEYRDALEELEKEALNDDNDLRIKLLSNITLCYLNLYMFEHVLEYADMVIQLDPENAKA